jgi:hypothetical protein
MAISTIPNDAPLSSIKEQDGHTRSSLEANPLTAALAVPFADFIVQVWEPAVHQEQALEYGITLATAKQVYADDVLDGLVKKLDSALLMITNKDRTAPLYVQFFGAQRPFEVARGVLGLQLETMRSWIPLLSGSPLVAPARGGARGLTRAKPPASTARPDDRASPLHAAQSLDMEQGSRGPLREHQSTDRGPDS